VKKLKGIHPTVMKSPTQIKLIRRPGVGHIAIHINFIVQDLLGKTERIRKTGHGHEEF
jgi:hypothetical protein